MPAPNEKLAASLAVLGAFQQSGQRVFQSQEFDRADRERLVENGFLQEVLSGWLISVSPATRPGDSTPWYASFWEFCARYCDSRFGADWHLSPEQSLLLHGGETVVPRQVLVQSTGGMNNKINLLFGTSLFDSRVVRLRAPADLEARNGLRLFLPEAALLKVSDSFFEQHPVETRVVISGIGDASELLRRLLDGGHTVIAGRLAGAFRHVDRPAIASEIVATMKSAGYDVREHNPFAPAPAVSALPPAIPAIAARLRTFWELMRPQVLKVFPKPPGLPRNKRTYLRLVEELYRSDAYHSLSIEGYSVTPELVERVRAGRWNPNKSELDRLDRDALAARGYWQAFQSVKSGVEEIIGGANAGRLARDQHRDWYRNLFQPCVLAGLVNPGALAGYRNDAVYLRGSRYVPPRWEAVRDAMPVLFELLAEEPEPAVRAVLSHWLLGYVHPYPDGNGRIARFLMNLMLASGGYPWTVIKVEDRELYMAALDQASVEHDIGPFAAFLAERVRKATRQQQAAARRKTAAKTKTAK